jgi:hypothetical protein
MIEAGGQVPEVVRVGLELAPLAVPLLMAFQKKQRDSIVERDDGQCQYPVYRENGKQNCGSINKLNVHHCSPQRWDESHGVPQHQRDTPDNSITLCGNHHGEVHPDMKQTLYDYGRQKKVGIEKPTSFKDMFDERGRKVERGEKYWDDTMDDAFREIARDRTDYKRTQGKWKFPWS